MLVNRLKALWPNLTQGLWFIPGLLAVLYGGLAVGLVQVDKVVDFTGVEVVFKGDASAARTVLSVLAGSLITVAGLTFSITIVVLQLASSQFSPRVLRTFFSDRLTQVTVGSYIGIFIYAILVLRAVGSFEDGGSFVPRLSITVASALGIGAVVLLIVFIHHIAQMIQVSHITASIVGQTLNRVDKLYPDRYGEPIEGTSEERLEEWRRHDEPGRIKASRPGFVRRVGLDELVEGLDEGPERLAVLVQPGDFVSPDVTIAEVWPAEAAEEAAPDIHAAVALADERDIGQDIGFGLRQLSDIAVKAMSPGINDPTTAVTCISYLRAVVGQLASRAFPSPVRTFPEHADVEVFVARRSFEDYLVPFLEVGRYASGDAYVVTALLEALEAVARLAVEAGAHDRAREAVKIAEAIGEQAIAETKMELDRRTIERHLEDARSSAGVPA